MREKCLAIFSGRRAFSDSRLNLLPSNAGARTALGPSSICAKPWPRRDSIPGRRSITFWRWTTTCPIRSMSRVSPEHCTIAVRTNRRAIWKRPVLWILRGARRWLNARRAQACATDFKFYPFALSFVCLILTTTAQGSSGPFRFSP
jgi:hypothetical protein